MTPRLPFSVNPSILPSGAGGPRPRATQPASAAHGLRLHCGPKSPAFSGCRNIPSARRIADVSSGYRDFIELTTILPLFYNLDHR